MPNFDPGPYTAIVDTDFSQGDDGTWTTGATPHTSVSIGEGRLTISVADGARQISQPRDLRTWASGEVSAVARVEGSGEVGIMGRFASATPGHWSAYAFWIRAGGTCGLTRWLAGEHEDLFSIPCGAIRPHADNLLALRTQAGELTVWINGQQVFTLVDRQPLPAGTWGAYVYSLPGQGPTQGQFAHLSIYRRNA